MHRPVATTAIRAPRTPSNAFLPQAATPFRKIPFKYMLTVGYSLGTLACTLCPERTALHSSRRGLMPLTVARDRNGDDGAPMAVATIYSARPRSSSCSTSCSRHLAHSLSPLKSVAKEIPGARSLALQRLTFAPVSHLYSALRPSSTPKPPEINSCRKIGGYPPLALCSSLAACSTEGKSLAIRAPSNCAGMRAAFANSGRAEGVRFASPHYVPASQGTRRVFCPTGVSITFAPATNAARWKRSVNLPGGEKRVR